MIRWKRANDGFVESHCGHWKITPCYAGSTRPQDYQLWRDGKRVGGMIATQREAKLDADRLDHRTRAAELMMNPKMVRP